VKKYLYFLLRFLAVSIALYILREPLIFGYESVLLLTMSVFTGEFASYYYDSSFRLIMLLSLLLATPGIKLKRRSLFVLYAICSLLLLDLASFFIWTTPPPLEMGATINKPHMIYSLIWRMLGHWVLPFVFWVLMARQQLTDWLSNIAQTEQ
jgi:hypothetical protein